MNTGQILEALNDKADRDIQNLDNTGKNMCASLAMPTVMSDLTLGASGSTIVAPANGYFRLQGVATGANSYVALYCTLPSSVFSVTSGQNICVHIPVYQGQTCTYFYSGLTDTYFAFVYADGSK